MENCFNVSTFEERIDFSKYPESQDLDCSCADSPCNVFLVRYIEIFDWLVSSIFCPVDVR